MRRFLWFCLLLSQLFFISYAKSKFNVTGTCGYQLNINPDEIVSAIRDYRLETSWTLNEGNSLLKVRNKSFNRGFFIYEPNIILPLQLEELRFETTIEAGGKPIRLSMGTVPVNYSPYIMKRDGSGWGANPFMKGVSIDGVAVNQSKISAFVAWDGEGLVQGAKTDLFLLNSPVSISYCNYSSPETAGSIMEEETNFCYEYRRPLGNDLVLFSLHASQNKAGKNAEVYTWGASLPLSSALQMSTSYLHFAPAFAPRYRDRLNRYDWQGRSLGWNPVDKHIRPVWELVDGTYRQVNTRGEKGWLVNISGNVGNTDVDVELSKIENIYLAEVPYKELVRNAAFTIKRSLSGGFFRMDFELNNVFRTAEENQDDRSIFDYYGVVEVEKDLKIGNQPYKIQASWNDLLIKEAPRNQYDILHRVIIQQVNAETRFRAGKLQGTVLRFGIRFLDAKELAINKASRPFFSAQYTIPNGIKIDLNLTKPIYIQNIEGDRGYYFDVEGIYCLPTLNSQLSIELTAGF